MNGAESSSYPDISYQSMCIFYAQTKMYSNFSNQTHREVLAWYLYRWYDPPTNTYLNLDRRYVDSDYAGI